MEIVHNSGGEINGPATHARVDPAVLRDSRLVWVLVAQGARDPWDQQLLDEVRCSCDYLAGVLAEDLDAQPVDPAERAREYLDKLPNSLGDDALLLRQGERVFAGYFMPDADQGQRGCVRERLAAKLTSADPPVLDRPDPGLPSFDCYWHDGAEVVGPGDLQPFAYSDFFWPGINWYSAPAWPKIPLETLIHRAEYRDAPGWLYHALRVCGYNGKEAVAALRARVEEIARARAAWAERKTRSGGSRQAAVATTAKGVAESVLDRLTQSAAGERGAT
jgi:hypothetical protein